MHIKLRGLASINSSYVGLWVNSYSPVTVESKEMEHKDREPFSLLLETYIKVKQQESPIPSVPPRPFEKVQK